MGTFRSISPSNNSRAMWGLRCYHSRDDIRLTFHGPFYTRKEAEAYMKRWKRDNDPKTRFRPVRVTVDFRLGWEPNL